MGLSISCGGKARPTANDVLVRIHDVTFDNLQELEMTFKKMDLNGDGQLSKEELGKSLKEYGFPTDDELLTELFGRLDANKDGMVTYAEFTSAVASSSYSHAPLPGSFKSLPDCLSNEEALLRIKARMGHETKTMSSLFKEADKDNNGVVAGDELAKVLRTGLGFELSDDMVARLFDVFDKDGDGTIAYAEFMRTIESELGQAAGAGLSKEESTNRALAQLKSRTKLASDKVSEDRLLTVIHSRMVDGASRVTAGAAGMDSNKDGRLTYVEVGRFVQSLGFDLDGKLTESLLGQLDKEGKGSVQVMDLVRGLCTAPYMHADVVRYMSLPADLTNEEAILRIRNGVAMNTNPDIDIDKVFHKADEDKNSVLTVGEFQVALELMGFQLDMAMARRLFRCFDRDGSGDLNRTEFLRVVHTGKLV